MERYLLQKSTGHPLMWVLTDVKLGIVITFKEGEFNNTQKVTVLDDREELDASTLAKAGREMCEWLEENHYEIIFSSPQLVKEHYRKAIGRELKALREERKVTVRQLAKLTGLKHPHIVRIEQGKYNVTLDTLALLVSALGGQLFIDA